MDTSLSIASEVTTSQRSRLHRRQTCLGVYLFVLLGAATPRLAAQTAQAGTDSEISNPSAESERTSPRGRVRDLPRDIAKSSLRLFSQDNLLPWIVGMGATAASHPADVKVREYFERPRFGQVGGELGTRLGNGPFVAAAVGSLFVVSRFRGSEEFARFSYDLTQASLLNGLLTGGLKHAVQRTRPSGGNYSFPSGHTSTAFAAAAVVDHYYGWKTSVAAYAAATFVGVSRIDTGKHYVSDVAAGATVGYIVGRTVTHRSKTKHAFLWAPIVSPSSETVGIAIVWEPHSNAR
jgi:membrane-associated phospholipid phosphatase